MNTDKNLLQKVTLGTAGIGGAWRPIDFDQSVDTVLYALEQGITHIDMAPAYMDAELIVGKAIQQWKGEKLFLSTKIGKERGRADQEGLIDFNVNSIKSSLNTSLKRLGRDYIDLLFLHEPDQISVNKIHSVIDTVLFFKEQGWIKKIGFGGRPPKLFTPFIEKGYFDVVMDFNGYNLLERKALRIDFPFYRKHGLEIYEGSPLMMGLLGRRFEQYSINRPSWLMSEHIHRTSELQLLASKLSISLASMAHRYLLFSNEIDRMVIGPAVFNQLESTIDDIKKGPLPTEVLEKIDKIIFN